MAHRRDRFAGAGYGSRDRVVVISRSSISHISDGGHVRRTSRNDRLLSIRLDNQRPGGGKSANLFLSSKSCSTARAASLDRAVLWPHLAERLAVFRDSGTV